MSELGKKPEKDANSSKPEADIPLIDNTGDGLAIEGLNTGKGIALTGDKMENYLKILSMFHKNGTEKKMELEECLETGNIALYTFHIHAIKSTAALIGADILSKDAAELEEAGKRGDLVFIQSRSPVFIKELEDLLCAIDKALASSDDQTGKNAKISTEINLLKPELLRLKRALIAFDSSEIYKADSALQRFTNIPEIGGPVSTILQCRLLGDYEKAISLIDKLL